MRKDYFDFSNILCSMKNWFLELQIEWEKGNETINIINKKEMENMTFKYVIVSGNKRLRKQKFFYH